MSTSNLNLLLVSADYQITLRQQREVLKSEFHDACVFAFNGGLFELTPEFLAGLETRTKYSQGTDTVGPVTLWVLDQNQTAIQIDDAAEFIKEATEQYNNAIADFGKAWNIIRRQRSVEGIIGK